MNRFQSLQSVAIVFILFILNCGSASKKYIQPEYLKKKINDASLLVAPIQGISFSISDEMVQELNLSMTEETHRSLFANVLKKSFTSQSTFKEIYPGDYKERQDFKRYAWDVGKNGKVEMDIPKSYAWIDSRFPEDGFILFLKGVNLYINKEEKDSAKPAWHYTVSGDSEKDAMLHPLKYYNYYVHYDAAYALFNRNLDTFVTYGKANVKRSLQDRESFDKVLMDCIKKLSKQIVNQTPFEK